MQKSDQQNDHWSDPARVAWDTQDISEWKRPQSNESEQSHPRQQYIYDVPAVFSCQVGSVWFGFFV